VWYKILLILIIQQWQNIVGLLIIEDRGISSKHQSMKILNLCWNVMYSIVVYLSCTISMVVHLGSISTPRYNYLGWIRNTSYKWNSACHHVWAHTNYMALRCACTKLKWINKSTSKSYAITCCCYNCMLRIW